DAGPDVGGDRRKRENNAGRDTDRSNRALVCPREPDEDGHHEENESEPHRIPVMVADAQAADGQPLSEKKSTEEPRLAHLAAERSGDDQRGRDQYGLVETEGEFEVRADEPNSRKEERKAYPGDGPCEFRPQTDQPHRSTAFWRTKERTASRREEALCSQDEEV